jgi:signal transduction histidine kinase
MGLGLSLCNRIMEQHGGRIWVWNEEGRYSEFVLVLPAKGAIMQPEQINH